MSIAYVLAPNIRYYVETKCGVPAVGGKLITLNAQTGLPKSTYRDPYGLVPNNPEMQLGSDGSPGYSVYWKVESGQPLYRVLAFDGSGNLIYMEPNYPIDASITDITVNVSIESTNYFLNEQFSFWDYGTTFNNDTLPVGSTQVATNWFFERSNTDASITIEQHVYAAGENAVPFSPRFAMTYTVTVPAADGQSDFVQFFDSVQTLNNQQVTVGIYPKSEFLGESSTIEVLTYQYFGVGGSTPVETAIQTINVTDAYASQQVTFVVPSIAGQVIGGGGDDYLKIIFRMNPALVQKVTISDAQFQNGIGTGINYPGITNEEQYAKLLPDELLGTEPTQGANIVAFSGTNTPGEIITVKQAIVNTAPEISNLLYCPYMPTNPNQYGAVVDSTTIVPNNDGTYIADGVILQSDGDNVVSKNSFVGNDLTLTIVTAGKKFGLAQIFSNSDLERFVFFTPYNSIASAFVRSYAVTAATPIFKVALIGWTGALDVPTKQIVSSWNPAGTDPTLSPGWSYLSASEDLTLSDGQVPFVLEGVDLSGGLNNAAIFCWVDSEDMLVGDQFIHNEWGVNQGYVAFQPFRPTKEESLAQAECYLKKSYDKNNVLAWGYVNDKAAVYLPCVFGDGANPFFNEGIYESNAGPIRLPHDIGTPDFYATIPLSLAGSGSPSVTFYNPSLDATLSPPSINYAHFYYDLSVDVGITFTNGSFEVPISAYSINQESLTTFCSLNLVTFTIDIASLGHFAIFSNFGVFVNYVADATIGV